MRMLRNVFKKLRPLFDEGGKFHRAVPLFDAMENFFYGPDTRTAVGPHVRDPLDVKRYMTMVIIGLLPCTLMSFYLFGWHVLAMIIVSYMAGGAVEVAFAMIRKEEIAEGFLVTGLIFPLCLPPATPLWVVAVGVIFGVLVGKEIFGGTGRNLFNPALVGRCFLALAYPKVLADSWVVPGWGGLGRLTQYVGPGSVDAMTTATPLAAAKQVPQKLAELSDLFLGNVGGCAGETSSLVLILGGVFIVICGVASWRTVVSTLGSFMILTTILHLSNGERFASPVWHFMAGGLLYGAFFMATDPVSSPITNGGKWMYGMIIGVCAVLIRNFTGFVEGVMFSILLGNITAPVLDEIVYVIHQRRLPNEG